MHCSREKSNISAPKQKKKNRGNAKHAFGKRKRTLSYFHYSIGSCNATNNQQKLFPFLPKSVFSSELWPVTYSFSSLSHCPNLGVGLLDFRCIHSCVFTLWLVQNDFQVLSRKFEINFKLVPIEISIPIKQPIIFPNIQWISHAYSQCDREANDGIGECLSEDLP